MEKKNTILLTVIAVATLLVAVVGATFAYFTATSSTDGAGSSTGAVNTATVASVKLTTADAGKSTNTVYPGTSNYAGMSVIASKEGSDSADYDITFTLNGTITLSKEFTAGTVNYTVYRTTSPVSSPVTCEEVTTTPDAAGTKYSQTCTVDSSLTSDAKKVVDGQTVSGTSATITVTDQTLSTTGNTTYYYYVVVSYPDTSSDQNADQNKTITAELTNVSITNTAQKA